MWTLIYDVLDEKCIPTIRKSVDGFNSPYLAARFIDTDLSLRRSRPVAILQTSSAMVDLMLRTREIPKG